MGSFGVSADAGWGYTHAIALLKMSKSEVSEAGCCTGEQPLCLKHIDL